ncbi:hypothetical protein Tco_0937586 [Tanacetum coccineum]|uniref:Uncharacterized protein n=1 Tax=Tanacetum coccineum TaxID=301880 RepID=A0ABQ5DEP4_9ASTR
MGGSADCMKDVAEIAANKGTKDVFAANGSDGAFVGSKGAYNGEANVTVSVGSKQVTKVGKYGGTQMIEDHGIADVNTTSANDTKKDGEPALFESGDCGPSNVYLKVVNGHLLKLGEAEQAVVERATAQFRPQALVVARGQE